MFLNAAWMWNVAFSPVHEIVHWSVCWVCLTLAVPAPEAFFQCRLISTHLCRISSPVWSEIHKITLFKGRLQRRTREVKLFSNLRLLIEAATNESEGNYWLRHDWVVNMCVHILTQASQPEASTSNQPSTREFICVHSFRSQSMRLSLLSCV